MCIALTEDVKVLGLEVLQVVVSKEQQARQKAIAGETYVCGLVELEVHLELGDLIHALLRDIPANTVEVLLHDGLTVGLGDHGKATLGSPAQQDLGRGLANLLGNTLDDLVLHQWLRVLGLIHVALDETSRAEG